MNKTKLAKAVSIAIAMLSAGPTTVLASTTMYNTYNAGSDPGYVGSAASTATDGWTFTNGTTNSGTRNPWYGTAAYGGTVPFGFTGVTALSWAIELTGSGDSGTISALDSATRYSATAGYVGAADIDTAKGGWEDGQASPTGWRHGIDIGLIKVNQDTVVRLTPSTIDGVSANNFGISVYEGMDTTTTSWNHHGAWNTGYVAGDVTTTNLAKVNSNNPIGTSGLTFLNFMDSSGLGTYGTGSVTFTAKAGKIYTVILGGRDITITSWSSPIIGYAINVSTSAPVREDNNGDKHADILWYNPVSVLAGSPYGDAYELLSDVGLSVPTAPITVSGQFAGVPIPSPWTIKGRGDYNGDGKSDILWGNSSNQLYVALRTATSPAAYTLPTTPLNAFCTPATSTVVGTGDYNGDKLSDILLQNSNGDVSLLLMNGATILNSTSCATTFATRPSTTSILSGSGDYNGDGIADILWGDASAGSASVQLTGTTGLTSISGLSGYAVQGSGYYNTDAKSDILFRNAAGNVYIKTDITTAGPGTPISYVGSSLIPPAWQVKGTGDYDGDGVNDILWRNESTTDPLGGYNYVFLMNGSTLGAVRGVDTLSNFLPAPYNLIPVSTGWDIVYTQTQ